MSAGESVSAAPGRRKRYLTWAVLSLLLLVMGFFAVVSTFLATESGSRVITQWGLARAAELEGIEVSVQDIRGNLLQGLRLREIDFTTPAVSVRAESILADWDPFSLLSGNFRLALLQLEEIDVQLVESGGTEPANGESPLASFGFSPLPVGISIEELSVSGLRITSGQQQIDIGAIASQISLQGTGLELTGLGVDSELIVLSGSAAVELAPGLPLSADLQWSYPQALPQQLGSASGALELAGSVERLQLSHALQTPFAIDSTGVIEPFAAQGPALDLQHRSNRIALPEQLRSLTLERLQLTTRGTTSAMDLILATNAQLPDAPPLALNIDGSLAGESLTLSGEVESPGGRLLSNVVLDYTNGIDVTGSFNLNESDPLALVAAFTGGAALTEFPLANLQVAGEFDLAAVNETLGLQISLGNASAELDGYQVSATGSISLDDTAWQLDNLSLTSSANQLLVNGRFDDSINLDWQINAPAWSSSCRVCRRELPGPVLCAALPRHRSSMPIFLLMV